MISNNITIAIGADHRGYHLKEFLKQTVSIPNKTISWIDVGALNDQRSDYPEFAKSVAQSVQESKAHFGILLCGTGVGMAVAANRFHGIYAALAWNVEIARSAKEDDHANVLVLPADCINADQALAMVHAWLVAKPKEGRYEKRIALIDAFDGKK